MLPKTAEYALRAAVWLARAPDRTEPAEHLAEAIRVPRRYLHKVLQDLVKAGLVRSQSGPGGGYSLNRDPDQISILDVINAVGPIERIQSCPLRLESHTRLCPLHQELDTAYAKVQEAFARVTVADVVNRPSDISPLCEVAANPAKRDRKL
jgi:Rrf2 family protein